MSTENGKNKQSPYEKAGLLSFLTYSYANKLINSAWHSDHPLTENDIYPIPEEFDTKRLADQIETEFSEQKRKGKSPSLIKIVYMTQRTSVAKQLVVGLVDISLKILKGGFITRFLYRFQPTI